jgi:hypothetical protein
MDDILDTTPDITVENCEEYIANVGWPATKSDIIYTAQMNKAPQIVMRVLQSLPDDGTYSSFSQVDYQLRHIISM